MGPKLHCQLENGVKLLNLNGTKILPLKGASLYLVTHLAKSSRDIFLVRITESRKENYPV